eukprot:jgi/Botrbrau1/12029/Bobra.0293s0006.1
MSTFSVAGMTSQFQRGSSSRMQHGSSVVGRGILPLPLNAGRSRVIFQRGSYKCSSNNGSVDGNNTVKVQRTYSKTYDLPDSEDGYGLWDKITTDEIEEWNNGPETPLLDTIKSPLGLKNYSMPELRALCKELRADIIHTVSQTGGHLGSSLGVAELTVALHYVFNCPYDKIIWDVGHQAYGHKILTGRRAQMPTIRQYKGLSGFTKRSESEYDAFGAGHSSTSISAALGMAVGRDFKNQNNHAIAVIGDGAITGGMAYEALNHAGFMKTDKMIVILNDNKQVSLPTQYNAGDQKPVGALAATLAEIQADPNLREIRETIKNFAEQMPAPIRDFAKAVDDVGHDILSQNSGAKLFKDLKLWYIGPVDGHDVGLLVKVLQDVKKRPDMGPVLIHILTEKGRGYEPAETSMDRMHGVGKYDTKTGKALPSTSKSKSYTNVYADSLAAEAALDPKILAVHAAMGGGTGMNRFEKRFASRTFDVGIAEQHAVTFAAGLASEGLKPFCAIYSTFLQRAFDQIIHDVALQNLPVRFAIDRGGLVGADGATHGGFADVTYMACVPNMVVMAPSNEAELCHAVATAAAYNDGPSCFRFPRGDGIGVDMEAEGVDPKSFKGQPWEIGKGVIRRLGKHAALLGYGTMVNDCLAAAEELAKKGIDVAVMDMRFCKPLDTQLVEQAAKNYPIVITVEENAIGGFGSHVCQPSGEDWSSGYGGEVPFHDPAG